MKPLVITIPHSGEKIPDETPWFKNLPEVLLMYDVDRYVDRLYEPILQELQLPAIKTEWHRYAIDLNRWKDDIDSDSVEGAPHASGTFPRGLHWSTTTEGEKLMPQPMSREVHDILVEKYFEPFHVRVRQAFAEHKAQGHTQVFHIDLHSMPSKGTAQHRDPGQMRADVVVSDCKGVSCPTEFKDLVIRSYEQAGLSVAYNWPYFGGRVTETYGKPQQGQNSIQVELNRALYMNETTKHLKIESLSQVQKVLGEALRSIYKNLP